MIFQDPYNSLNPRKKAWELIAAPLIISRDTPHDEAYQEAIKYMKMVGLSEDMAHRYPHMFSGVPKTKNWYRSSVNYKTKSYNL